MIQHTPSAPDTPRPVRIGNCSGFYGDRLSAARELVDSDQIDVLTGDWLAELTMLILARQRMKQGAGSGYARTFLTQMEQVLGTCLERGVKVVSNAGGLDPQGCGDALAKLADKLGLSARIAVVTGDDVVETVGNDPGRFPNLDTGEPLGEQSVITANAYLGGRPVTAALAAGADVVVTGRITDAALVIGPAAWWHGWSFSSAEAGDQLALDRLAGAVVAGHVIECGTQATGGNYSFFQEVTSWPLGFPIAEVAVDGSSVITKPTGSGGLVSVGTVTSQLVYEIAGPRYANPDVTTLFDTVRLTQEGPDRVRIEGVRGAPPPEALKVAVNLFAGYRNSMSLVLTGRDSRAKADLALRMVAGLSLADALGDPESGKPAPSPRELATMSSLDVAELAVALDDVGHDDPAAAAAAQGHLRITVKDPSQGKVGRPFTSAIVESALGSYPGMFPTQPPGEGSAYGVYWPTLIARDEVPLTVTLAGEAVDWEALDPRQGPVGEAPGALPVLAHAAMAWWPEPGTPLGDVVGARSGDKGGNANVGLWIPVPGVGPSVGLTEPQVTARYDWLRGWLTVEQIHRLVPESRGLQVDVHALPNILAVNVVIHGLLGRGVADSTSVDPQAKGLAEQVRARRI